MISSHVPTTLEAHYAHQQVPPNGDDPGTDFWDFLDELVPDEPPLTIPEKRRQRRAELKRGFESLGGTDYILS